MFSTAKKLYLRVSDDKWHFLKKKKAFFVVKYKLHGRHGNLARRKDL